jgi:hypothetical protein
VVGAAVEGRPSWGSPWSFASLAAETEAATRYSLAGARGKRMGRAGGRVEANPAVRPVRGAWPVAGYRAFVDELLQQAGFPAAVVRHLVLGAELCL